MHLKVTIQVYTNQ